MKIFDMTWMQVEAYLQRDNRGVRAAGQHGTARLPEPGRGQHSRRNASPSRRRSRWACPCFPAVAYGVTPYFRGFPGTISLRVETYMHVGARHSRWPGAQRLPARRARERARRQRPGGGARHRVDGGPSARAGQVPQLVERAAHLGQGAGDRPDWAATPRGWRTSPGRGCRMWQPPAEQKTTARSHRHGAAGRRGPARLSRRRQLRRLLSACRTKRCSPCGRSPSKRRAS